MKLIPASLSLAFASLLLPGLAFAGPKEDVEAAAKKLAEAENYSWTSTTEMGGGNGDFKPRPIKGKSRKDGVTMVSMTGRDDQTIESFVKGDTVVMQADGEWKTGEEVAAARAAANGNGGDANGRGRGGRGGPGGMMRGMKAPAAQAAEIISKIEGLEEKDGALTGKLSNDAVKEMLTFGGRGRGGNGGGPNGGTRPEPTDTSGTVTFWMKDGAIAKMAVNVKGKITFGDRNMDIDRTTTTEISEVGSTAIDIPTAAAAKLDAAKPAAEKPAETK